MRPIVAITVGDYNGIGPEVVLKSLTRPDIRKQCIPLLVGPPRVFEHYARRLSLPVKLRPYPQPDTSADNSIAVFDSSPLSPVRIRPGMLSAQAGAAAGAAIEQAVKLVRRGFAHALVTAPVSKQALHWASFDVPGQTEMLQRLTRSRHVAMMLVSPTMRVGLVTIHLPLRAVARSITGELLRSRIIIIHDALRIDWRIRHPRLAVLGLNPHAGEGGDIGPEEQRLIIPAIAALRRRGMNVAGPFPADAFFARYDSDAYDAVVAMYHDQGLIPLKLSARGAAVNVSVGLPIVRTSPDHGTGFNIAGKGIADPGSTVAAIHLALEIARNRRMPLRRKAR